jgi:hypothetical protein
MPDYIPSSDAEFSIWMKNYSTKLNTLKGSLNLNGQSLTDLGSLQSAYDADLQKVNEARASMASAAQAKDKSRQLLEESVRQLTRELQVNTALTDADKADLQITVTDQTRTPAAVPQSRPVAQVDTSKPQQHTISWVDEATPTSKAKPEGVYGCELRCQIGGAEPVNPDDMKFLAIDTRSPYVAHYDGADAGKTIYYRLRWVNTRNEHGPWSDIYSATITK